MDNSNSRFFTNCYLDLAAFVPPHRRIGKPKSQSSADNWELPSHDFERRAEVGVAQIVFSLQFVTDLVNADRS